MTTLAFSPVRRPQSARTRDLISAAIFWAFTYLLFTYRTQLRYGDDAVLADPKRLVSTMIGAAVLYVILHYFMPASGQAPRRPGQLIAAVIPASLLMLAVRVIIDQLAPSGEADFANSLRFVSVWGGYFGLWVCATLALRYAELPRFRIGRPSKAQSVMRVDAKSAPTVAVIHHKEDPAAWDDVLDWLSEEMMMMPNDERRQLAERLIARAGYETVDPLAAPANDRVAIARRLANRVRPQV
nr:hypothetical protein [uncultured Sphingomonas sp.]